MNINCIFRPPSDSGTRPFNKSLWGVVSITTKPKGYFFEMKNEVWKDVPGYEGIYKVSDKGRIKSLSRKIVNQRGYSYTTKEKIMKQSMTSSGYYMLALSKSGKASQKSVHSIVALAFLGFKGGSRKIVIDHVDNDKTNNHLENLQIVTNRFNSSKDRQRGITNYTGISWYESIQKWKVSFGINRKVKHLGYFDDEQEAYEAYQRESEKELQRILVEENIDPKLVTNGEK